MAGSRDVTESIHSHRVTCRFSRNPLHWIPASAASYVRRHIRRNPAAALSGVPKTNATIGWRFCFSPEQANSLACVQDSKAIGDARSEARSRRGGVAGRDRVHPLSPGHVPVLPESTALDSGVCGIVCAQAHTTQLRRRSFLSQDGAFLPFFRAHLPTTASYAVVGQVKNYSPIRCQKPCMAFRFSGHGARAAKPPLHLINACHHEICRLVAQWERLKTPSSGAGRDPEVGKLLKIPKDWIPARASARFILSPSKGRNDEICGFLEVAMIKQQAVARIFRLYRLEMRASIRLCKISPHGCPYHSIKQLFGNSRRACDLKFIF